MPDYCLHLHRSSEFKFPAQGSKNSFCKINDDDWTHFERAAWLQICSNGYTALDKVPIRASFIRDIIIDKPYADTSKINGIVIDNAVITGDLNLAGITFDGALSITHSIVQGNTNLSNSKFGKTVSFVGTHLLKGILANHATITGSLLLGKLDRVEPDHEPITLRNTVEIGIIKANSIHLDGSLNVFGARLGDYLDVHESRITGDLNLMNVIGHQILAYESNIGGQAVIVDCHLSPPKKYFDTYYPVMVQFFDTRIGKSVFFNRSQIPGTVEMESSEIGHDINLLGTHLDSLLLASALVHGHLGLGRMFYFDQEKDDTKWSTTGELDLRNANIGAIHAPLQLSFWPQLIRFGGFSLGQFLSTDCSEEVQPCAAGEDWYEQWLNLGDFESQKSFQSHQIIMNMLLAQGDRDSANQVGVDGHDKELMYSVTEGKWSHFLFLFLSKDTVGYGLHPEWCVLSILLATCLGAYVFTRTNEARKWKMRFGIAYSFDMLLPIIRLRELHYKIDIRGPARYYLYIHRLLGFVFGSFLVAAFAGWVK